MGFCDAEVTFLKNASQFRYKFRRNLFALVFTIALATFFSPSVCVSDKSPEHVPTLKEIFGGVPKNSFPLVHRDASTLRSSPKERESQSDKDYSSLDTQSNSHYLRRGMRSKPSSPNSPKALTAQVSSVGFSVANSGLSAYFAQLQLGTPAQTVLLLIDTGSPLFWTQIKECEPCETELLPYYDPKISSTYQPEIVNGSGVGWGIIYGDGSENVGFVARDTLTIDSGLGNRAVIPGFAFGASLNNSGVNYESSGILGLSPTYPEVQFPPFLTQLETISNGTYSKFAKKFRYCFPDRVTQVNATSFLSFGDIDESDTNSLFSSGKFLYERKFLWTPLVPNMGTAGIPYRALNLTAISIGGVRINIDPAELTEESTKNNGTITIIDTGSTMNYFREPYFSKFVEIYSNLTANLHPVFLVQDASTQVLYFNISRDVFDAYVFPTVSFIFRKWQSDSKRVEHEEIEVFQSKDNVLIPGSNDNGDGTVSTYYQVNITPSPDPKQIIGNFAQSDFLIEYDLEKSRLGFLRASCAFEY